MTQHAGTRPPEPAPEIPPAVLATRTAAAFGWILGFPLAIWLLGFTTGGVLCTFLALKIGSRERWPISLAITAGAWAFVYGVFVEALHVPFPPGALFAWLHVSVP